MIEVAFFSIFLIKEEQQELLAQIIDELNSFINNPLCRIWSDRLICKWGLLNIYSISTRGTATSLMLAGISRIEISCSLTS
jgi:hypothetical protein